MAQSTAATTTLMPVAASAESANPSTERPGSAQESPMFDDGHDIASTMQHADNHDLVRKRLVVDSVGAMERDA